jgi:hypothetical protein
MEAKSRYGYGREKRAPSHRTIDFEEFYRPLFPSGEESKWFSDRVEGAPDVQRPVKEVFHQAARLTWLGDRINEIAAGRPALQILFYLITAETIAKLTYKFEGRGRSREYVHAFFEKLCGRGDQLSLTGAFTESLSRRPLSLSEAVDLLYDVRCDVAHRGMYYVFTLPLDRQDYPELVNTGDMTVETMFTLGALRQIVLRGAIRACSMIMGDEPVPPL